MIRKAHNRVPRGNRSPSILAVVLALTASSFPAFSQSASETSLDRPINEKLESLGIRTTEICSDNIFVRRVYLDLIGTLPTAAEARGFLADRDPDKRRILIDRLLKRREFVDYRALKWCDLLRVKSEFPINLWPNAVQAYHQWIRESVRQDKPYDDFVRELLISNGSNFRVPQVNFYRAVRDREPETVAKAVALTFMGIRSENLSREMLSRMAVFFEDLRYKQTNEWKEEIVFVDLFDRSSGGPERPATAIFPDGTGTVLSPGTDPRQIFADWLIRPENPWFTRNIVNRVWSWLFGRGIIHEPDDIRPDNPPSNPELLALLEKELAGAGYDLKHLYRLILNSAAYQRSSIPACSGPGAESQFAHYPLHPLDAEVLIDAICQITGTTESYSSLIPEPWTFIPEGERSISLADASVTSPFLDLFGRPARDTGLWSERSSAPTTAQKLHLLNSSHVRDKIESRWEEENDTASGHSPGFRGRGRRGSRSGSQEPSDSPEIPVLNPEAVNEIYLSVLSRFPTPGEQAIVEEYTAGAEAKGRDALVDLTWALINTPEFLYHH